MPKSEPASEPIGPAAAIEADAVKAFGKSASLSDRLAALEDIAKQTLGFLSWMFPAHPVPTLVQDAETGLLVAGAVAPAIVAAIDQSSDTKAAPPDTKPAG